jgi:hypothetical protein
VLDPVPPELARKKPADVGGADLDDGARTWLPAYSTVGGTLPLGDLPKAEDVAVSFARAEVRVSCPGKVRLKLNSIGGLSLWLDGRLVPLHEEMVLDLTRDLHTLTFRVDHDRRGQEGLRVELTALPGSKAEFEIVAGK